jgi:HEAT repeat protein
MEFRVIAARLMTPTASAGGFFVARPPAVGCAVRGLCVHLAHGIGSEQRAIGTVAQAIGRLEGLRDSDRAVLDLIALGRDAIPALREFLLRREPSGLYQPRCNCVCALAALHGDDVLLDFLERAPAVAIADPIERTGEDAVINASARALRHRRDDAFFAALMRIAALRPLAGVIDALGDMGRDTAIPRLVEGLSSDFTRGAATVALSKFGPKARPSLIAAASDTGPAGHVETAMRLRTRWSALGVLGVVGVTLEEWSCLKPLMSAGDARLAALACHLALATGQPLLDREEAIGRLINLLQSADWLLTAQIEGWLAENYDLTVRIINRAIDRSDSAINDPAVRRALLRVTGSAPRPRGGNRLKDLSRCNR